LVMGVLATLASRIRYDTPGTDEPLDGSSRETIDDCEIDRSTAPSRLYRWEAKPRPSTRD
jgi:hypothetical protein